MPVYLEALGSVLPTQTITVRTQVSGQLTRVLFMEGQDVKKNQHIAQIDERPYVAALKQAEGQLMRDEALLANAKVDLMRYEELYPQSAISKQTLDTQVWLVKQYEGAVKGDQGVVEQAKVNLSYCKISSPMNGRVGLRLVDQGNIVTPTDAPGLAVINTINPISVTFTLAEDAIPQVLAKSKNNQPLTVLAFDRTNKTQLATGTLLAMDNQIDPGTGTVKLKAVFMNDAGHLYPNQFVNMKIQVDTLTAATLVPTRAIQQGAKGPYVYGVEADNTVKPLSVKPHVTHGEDTVITSGITPETKVVVQGIEKLRTGIKITPVTTGKADEK